MLLAEPKRDKDLPNGDGTFALYSVSGQDGKITPEVAAHHGLEAVSRELENLLWAAEQYPPALALARDEVSLVDCETRAALSDLLVARLRHHLAAQPHAPYFLAEATQIETGHKYAGGFYWIVGYNPTRNRVAWVSSDFFVYSYPSSHFALDPALLAERFPVKA